MILTYYVQMLWISSKHEEGYRTNPESLRINLFVWSESSLVFQIVPTKERDKEVVDKLNSSSTSDSSYDMF